MARVSDFVAELLWRAGRVIARADDDFARNQGWQVSKGSLGLSRTVRHPGFDRLTRCVMCDGAGHSGSADCDRCAGTGRMALDDPGAEFEAVAT